MGTDLYYTIPQFFEKRMQEHDCVKSLHRLDVDDEFIYEIVRARYDDKIRVWLSDAYLFTEFDYDNRPRLLSKGDYILIAKPEGGYSVSAELVKRVKISVGKIGEFMGALNKEKMWTYSPPDRG
jgi:hypothetical protein